MSKTLEVKETPLMKQYNTIKAKYPDAILLFRVGDFYETFGEDAIKASKILGIVFGNCYLFYRVLNTCPSYKMKIRLQ